MSAPDISHSAVNATRPASALPGAVSSRGTRPLYWSVRRELWEHGSLYLAPFTLASVILVGALLVSMELPSIMREVMLLEADRRLSILAAPFQYSASIIILVAFGVAITYCLDAFYSERRDRSVLFWKSLPVSDTTVVLSKAIVPLVVTPVLTIVIVVALHILVLLAASAVLAINGANAAVLWTEVPILHLWAVLLYSVVALTLWYAPLYGWLLLCSAWARRAPFMWAVLPPLAIVIVEGIVFRTTHAGSIFKSRLFGSYAEAFVVSHERGAAMVTNDPDPTKFVTTPGLWIGLVVAAAFFAAAIWVRRRREPI